MTILRYTSLSFILIHRAVSIVVIIEWKQVWFVGGCVHRHGLTKGYTDTVEFRSTIALKHDAKKAVAILFYKLIVLMCFKILN